MYAPTCAWNSVQNSPTVSASRPVKLINENSFLLFLVRL